MCQLNTVPMKSQVGFLDVVVPPDILVDESSSDVIAREGSNVTLTCRAGGYPAPNISWRREDGEPIPLGSWQGKKVIMTKVVGEYLNITRVSRLHMGAYLCIASNGVPPSVSRRIMLHVHFSPVMWIPNQLVGAPLGKDVTLDCHTEAFPASVNYWSKDGGEIMASNEKYEISSREKVYKSHMRLVIHNLEKEDYGNYKCFSKNSLGATESAIRLYEIPQPTDLPTKETAANRRQSAEEFAAFPRHESLGSIKVPNELSDRRAKATIYDGKYQESREMTAFDAGSSSAAEKNKRPRTGNGKSSTVFSSVSLVATSLVVVLFSIRAIPHSDLIT